MTWADAQKFCVGNHSKTLPIVADEDRRRLYEAVLQQLPDELQLCSSWVNLHLADLSASVKWRLMDNNSARRNRSPSSGRRNYELGGP